MPLHSFPPSVDIHTQLLIIGSMPGTASLKAQQYYAYRYNQFWQLMFDILQSKQPPTLYAEKLNTLLIHRIGLWDTLACCERNGSLDAAISHPVPNNFPVLFTQFPHIHTLLFNGQAAARHFKHAFNGFLNKNAFILPSTSPAHASLSYAKKRMYWYQALKQALGELIP